MESIWRKSCQIARRKKLEENIETEILVIGAGMTGILTAWQLQKAGHKVVVVEGDQIGSGQTERTTAKITSQHGLIYQTLWENMGEGAAREYARENENAIKSFRKIIEGENIRCHLKESKAYLYSLKETDALEKEAEAARKLGIHAEFTKETELPFPVEGAIVFPGQAHFHPLEFLDALSKNLEIYEETRVLKVEEGIACTDKYQIKAKHLVFATHYPFLNRPGYYFMRMHQERSYVLALKNAGTLEGMYYGIDQDGLSFRPYEDYIFLGGGNHRTGENKEGGKYDFLMGEALRLFPECVEAGRWSAQDCMTIDQVPYIGLYSKETDNWYVAAGYQKWGMTSSMLASKRIMELINGENKGESVFHPGRSQIQSNMGALMEEGMHAVRDISRRFLMPGREALEKLKKGCGGVVDYEGEKVGVYKDEMGEVHMVTVKCPHLGCQLEWNPDEKSWDCPCHGSRFDYKGNLLDNPAQEGILYE